MKMKLEDICAINPHDQNTGLKIEVSFIPMSCVSDEGDVDISHTRPIHEIKKGYTPFRNGDVLMAKITPCMENLKGAYVTGLMNGIGYGSTEFHVLRANDNIICAEWLYYFSVSKKFRQDCERNMTGSGGQKRVPTNYIANYVLTIPSIQSQKQQAQTLTQLKDIIKNRRQQLRKLDELVKCRFVEMFGDMKIDDKGWTHMFLGDVCDVRDGTHDSPKYHAQGYPLITSKNVTRGVIDFTGCNMISEEDYVKICQRSKVNKGDIIMPMIGTVGCPVIVDTDAQFAIKNVALIKFPYNSTLLNTFVKHLLLSSYFETEVIDKIRGGTQKFISLTDIRQLKVYIPPMELQNAFASFVQQLDKSRFAIQRSLEETQKLFDSLMQEYFS